MNVVDNFFDKINQLPMLPKVVQEVEAQLKNTDVDLNALADTINHDQVLAARVLRMSNSAYYGCSRSIQTIEDALALIGLQNVETLVIASAVTTTFTHIPSVDLNRFWMHSLVTASIARQISNDAGLESKTAYIAGLLHSIGQLPMHIVFPAAGMQITQACRDVSVLDRKNIEQSILGLDHCQIGEVIAKLWNFPEAILCVLRYYAEPLKVEACACTLAPVVYVAAHIALGIEQGKSAHDIAIALETSIAQRLNIHDLEAFAEKIDGYHQFVQEARDYLN
jgi:HD-like signal output (HDOD) protein